MWSRLTPVLLSALLLAGCVGQIVPVPTDEHPTTAPVEIEFLSVVTGQARIRWSDGRATHTETIGGTDVTNGWNSTVYPNQYVAAMTVVPIGKGSKAACHITVKLGGDNPDMWATTLTDETTSTSTAGVCVIDGGSADDPTPAPGAQTFTVMGASTYGGASYRAATPAGNVEVEKLPSGQLDEREFTAAGEVSAVVVSIKADDAVWCRIRYGHPGSLDEGIIDVQADDGLGVIATCHGIAQSKATPR